MLRVKISDIKEKGLSIDDQIEIEDFNFKADDYLKLIKPLSLQAKFKKFENTVLSEVKVASRYRTQCYRTLEDIEEEWSDIFELDYDIKPTDEFIEFGEDVRQEVIMRLPTRVLSEEGRRTRIDDALDELPEEPKMHQPFARLKDID